MSGSFWLDKDDDLLNFLVLWEAERNLPITLWTIWRFVEAQTQVLYFKSTAPPAEGNCTILCYYNNSDGNQKKTWYLPIVNAILAFFQIKCI